MTTLDRYLLWNIAIGICTAAVILVPLFAFLDLLDQLGDVGQGYYTLAGACQYVLLLVPRRLVQLLPFIALLGNVIALGRLAVSLELTAMRAAGWSIMRIAAAPLLIGMLLIVVGAIMEQSVAPSSQQRALTRRSQALSESVELGAGLGIWTRDASRILRLGNVQRRAFPEDIEIIEVNKSGRLATYTRAGSGEIRSDRQWILNDATVESFKGDAVHRSKAARLPWQPFIGDEQIETLTRPAGSLSVVQLFELVHYLRRTGQEADAYALALWRKFGAGLTMIAMVIIAIPFAFGSVRSGIGHRLFLASVTGVAVYLLDQIVSNAGLLLNLRPEVIALAPGIALTALGMWTLRRLAR